MAPTQEVLSVGLPAGRTGPMEGDARGPFCPSEPSQPTVPAGALHSQSLLQLSCLGGCMLFHVLRAGLKPPAGLRGSSTVSWCLEQKPRA